MKQDKRGYSHGYIPAEDLNMRAFLVLFLLFLGVHCFAGKQTKIEQHMKILNDSSGNPVGSSRPLAASDDEAAIRTLEDRFAAAFNAGDVDAMMKNYIPGKNLIIFDVVPPRQHLGADAYRKAWLGFFAHFRGRPKIAITDLGITVDGGLGFSHSIQHVTGTDTHGHPVDRTVRVTDGYRKIGGNWLIALEHVSVPVDLSTGKPDLSSKP